MEQFVESSTATLWPFGTDKRMLYAIYAHFNTMMKKKHKVDLPSPVLQKLHIICMDIKSLIQIITGMTNITKQLDFELSTIYTHINDLTQYPQRHRGSYTLNTEESDHKRPPKTPEKIKKKKSRNPNKKKKRKKSRRKSQNVIIYDFDNIDPSDPSASEPDFNPLIIEDYRSDASINSDASNCDTPKTNKPNIATIKNTIDLIPKNYKLRHSRHIKSFDLVNALSYRMTKNMNNISTDSGNKQIPNHIIVHRPKPNPPKTPKMQSSKSKSPISKYRKSTNCTSSKSPSPVTAGTAPPPQLNFDIDSKSYSATKPVVISSVINPSIIKQNIHIISQSLDDADINHKNNTILALESDSDLTDTSINSTDKLSYSLPPKLMKSTKLSPKTKKKTKTKTKASKNGNMKAPNLMIFKNGNKKIPKAIIITPKTAKISKNGTKNKNVKNSKNSKNGKNGRDKKHRRNRPKAPPRKAKAPITSRRNTMPYRMNNRMINNNKAIACKSYPRSHSATMLISDDENIDINNRQLPDLSKMFESDGYIGSSDNETTPRPPLPKKSDKTVTLQVVHKTWKQRRQRPLPKPK